MNKIYAVIFEIVDDGDTEYGILDNKFYEDKDTAREAMLKDFDNTKSEFDNTDDIEESHSIDGAFLQANLEWYENWSVVELTK